MYAPGLRICLARSSNLSMAFRWTGAGGAAGAGGGGGGSGGAPAATAAGALSSPLQAPRQSSPLAAVAPSRPEVKSNHVVWVFVVLPRGFVVAVGPRHRGSLSQPVDPRTTYPMVHHVQWSLRRNMINNSNAGHFINVVATRDQTDRRACGLRHLRQHLGRV